MPKRHPDSLVTSLAHQLLNRRGIFFQLLFIVYLITLHPDLLSRLSKASRSHPDPLLGWSFLLIPFLELVGFWLKVPYLPHDTRQQSQKRSSGTIILIVLLPVLHVGMSAFLFIAGTQIAGLQPEGDAVWYWQLLYAVGFFLVIFKELGFIAMFLTFAGIEWTANQQDPPDILFLRRLRKSVQQIRLRHLVEDALGDALLLVFSSLGYTALWEYVGMSSPLNPYLGFWDYAFQLIGLFIYLMIVVPPLQAVYLLQDAIVQTTTMRKLWSGLQFALTVVAAFLSIR
jgi:hypothetical protein